MHKRFSTIFGPFAYRIIDSNNFCRSSSRFALGTSCQCFKSFVCNVVAPKNWISDDCGRNGNYLKCTITILTRISSKKLWKLPFLVALNPIQRTMLVGSIGLWSANHVRLIAVERPIDKIRLQLLRVILYRLPHPFLLHSNQFGNNLIFKFKKSLCTEFPMRWKTFTIFLKKKYTILHQIRTHVKSFFCWWDVSGLLAASESNKNHYDGYYTRFCERDETFNWEMSTSKSASSSTWWNKRDLYKSLLVHQLFCVNKHNCWTKIIIICALRNIFIEMFKCNTENSCRKYKKCKNNSEN